MRHECTLYAWILNEVLSRGKGERGNRERGREGVLSLSISFSSLRSYEEMNQKKERERGM